MTKLVRDAQKYNNLEMALFKDLNKSDRLLDHCLERLQGHKNLELFTEWLTRYFNFLKLAPRHIIPKYFTRVLNVILDLVEIKLLEKLKPNAESLKVF